MDFTEAVQNSISEIAHEKLVDAALAADMPLENRHPVFMEVAAAIVEPAMDEREYKEYCEYTEYDAENWAQWIRQRFGDAWGKIALVIAREGY